MEHLAWIVLGAIASGFGGYIGAYLKKKGESVATKEDFNDLKEQTRQLTHTTKEIQAKIDDQVWNRQRQWEMKRDILIEFARSISDFEQAIIKIGNKVENRSKSAYEAQLFSRSIASWSECSHKFERDGFVVGLVVSIRTQIALKELSMILRNATNDILRNETQEAYVQHHKNIVWKLEGFKGLIREELGIIMMATPQSNESSAARGPDPQDPAIGTP
jgi:hypothetical protein